MTGVHGDRDARVITVLVADDHPLVRTGLAGLLGATADVSVVGQASSGEEAVALARELRPDVVLMDLSMPGISGVEATRRVHADATASAVVVLTSLHDPERVRAALDAGAVGYLLKDADPQTVLDGVRAAAAGGVPLDPRAARALLPEPGGRASTMRVEPTGTATVEPGDTATVEPTRTAAIEPRGEVPAMTEREREVLGLLAEGLPNKQIGVRLGIRERTVKAHVGAVFRRIGVQDRTSAALWARDHRGGY
ncbi:response regulator [Curtobacterium sp. Leaf261]|uniref:response regulator n=1 Tax=Curtobacterium sp. Leaf261 TaxID=1736311 RepID=UPI000A823B1F|nr:response regulator transcription factor [Curtobacterium sp. Leaf261]